MTLRKRGRPAHQTWTWERAVQEWIEYRHKHRGLARETCRQAQHDLERFVEVAEQLGAENPRCCILAHVDSWIAQLAQRGLAHNTLNEKIVGLRHFLSFLFVESQLACDLASYVEGPRIYRDASVPPHYSWTEVEALCGALDASHPDALRDRAILLMLSTTGARAGEIASLTTDDMDCELSQVTFRRRKCGDNLTLPLVTPASEALRLYLQGGRPAGSTTSQLFLNSQGRPLSSSAVTRVVLRAASRAGREPRGAHAIRHAVGTHLYEQGVAPAKIALILGHHTLSSTRVYLRLSMKLLREVADNYAELL